MNYNACNEPVNEVKCSTVEPMQSLGEMMKETRAIASDIFATIRKINSYMFGVLQPCDEKNTEPTCFRDELTKTKCELLATREQLYNISSMLGM